jgi:hypothetical protein
MRLDASRLHFRGGIRDGNVKFQIESHYDAGPNRFELHEWREKNHENPDGKMSTWFFPDRIIASLKSRLANHPEIQVVTYEYCLRQSKDSKYQSLPGADAIYDISLAMWQIQKEVEQHLKLLAPPNY